MYGGGGRTFSLSKPLRHTPAAYGGGLTRYAWRGLLSASEFLLRLEPSSIILSPPATFPLYIQNNIGGHCHCNVATLLKTTCQKQTQNIKKIERIRQLWKLNAMFEAKYKIQITNLKYKIQNNNHNTKYKYKIIQIQIQNWWSHHWGR